MMGKYRLIQTFFVSLRLKTTTTMSVWCIILLVWLAFCAAVYIFAALDYSYYANSVADKFHRVIDAITEDE